MSAIFYAAMGMLCLAYTVLLILLQGAWVDPGAQADAAFVSFTSLEGVRAIFASDAGVTLGWMHYLTFDLFVGIWISRDADAKGFSRWVQAPFLLLTLFFGPAGLLWWLALREKRARKGARRKMN